MSKGKYLKKPQTSKVLKFKMNKITKQRIYALLGAAVLSTALFSPPSKAVSNPEPESPPPSTEVLQPTEPEIIYTIGIANDGAEIVVNGKSYKIDNNSFIIFSENEALAYDIYGNILKGDISADSFKIVRQMTSKEMSNYNISQVISEIDVNVRSSGEILDDNIISTVPSFDYVLSYKPQTPENDKEWIPTLSINGDNLYDGYIREDLLKEIDTFQAINNRTDKNMTNAENLMMVDTSKDDFISLNLRSEPKAIDNSNIIAEIPHGTFIHLLGETTQSGNRNWTLIRYETLDGTQFEGWVAENYLTSYIIQEETGSRVIDGINVNSSGNVTGIDISTIKPDDLKSLLQNGIPEKVYSKNGSFDTSQYSGNINFVYIKLGASPYGNGDFSPLEYNDYEQQVAICEELGIPYGFYYYSTALTIEEAQIELDCIKQRLEDLRKKFDMKNNKLEIAVDIELNDKNDRQYDGNIKKQTEAKAALINGILEEELCSNVLIYGPMRVMKPDLDQIISLEYLHSLLSNPDVVALWQCSLAKKNGDITEDLKNDIAYAEKIGFSTVSCQLVLDAKLNGQIDINNMDFEHYQKLINQEKEQDETTYSTKIDSQDDER